MLTFWILIHQPYWKTRLTESLHFASLAKHIIPIFIILLIFLQFHIYCIHLLTGQTGP
jgi:hypothetical protein